MSDANASPNWSGAILDRPVSVYRKVGEMSRLHANVRYNSQMHCVVPVGYASRVGERRGGGRPARNVVTASRLLLKEPADGGILTPMVKIA